jgi:hypothetical protein
LYRIRKEENSATLKETEISTNATEMQRSEDRFKKERDSVRILTSDDAEIKRQQE